MITEHILEPYPRIMWVAFEEDFDKIKSNFQMHEQDSELTHNEIANKYDAIVFRVYKDDNNGYLVFIINSSPNRILVHESLHVALDIYQDCGMEVNVQMDQEPLCYLVEYIYSLLENDVNQLKNE